MLQVKYVLFMIIQSLLFLLLCQIVVLPPLVDAKDGKITIVDFGETKQASNQNYILAFECREVGNANIQIVKAGFGTKESAAYRDLYQAILPDTQTIVTINNIAYRGYYGRTLLRASNSSKVLGHWLVEVCRRHRLSRCHYLWLLR